jgi:hypothetical protein
MIAACTVMAAVSAGSLKIHPFYPNFNRNL